ncbi:RluA family pseudouridine synthase [Roseivirga sp.]|uniref:RluA family pseudouridine synthase n=1 Tax=Roseivirga sp. TaxID=1964215 RepID=UPI003B8CB3C8
MEKIVQPLYEDNHLLIVNKPAGILIQGDSTGDKPLVEHCKDYIKEKYKKPGAVFLHPVHRLDRPVSGVIVFARTSKALERMNKIFASRKVQKTYWAIVKKHPPQKKGKLVSWLVKDTKRNVTTAYAEPVEGGLKAETNFKWMGKLNNHHLIEVEPLTGRPHQIRVHLAEMGSPIRGDLRYGFSKPNPDKSINLHARRLYFEHPVKKEPLIITAGLPTDQFWEQFLTLDDIKVKDKYVDKMY